MKKELQNSQMSPTDKLAMERTRLANERTFLAYFRTFIVFLSSGIAIIKINALREIAFIGYFLLIISPVLLVVGVSRFFYVKRQLRKYY